MRHKLLALCLAALTASLAACGDDDDDDGGGTPITPYQDDGRLTVMTRNLYLGADLAPVIAAGGTGNPTAVALAATQAWALVNTNSFETRAAAIAAEAAATLPDVIGLQEVSLWRTDFPADGPASLAEEVAIDYLGLLLQRLRERGLEYAPVAQVDLFDVEAPTAFGYDARLLDRQVLLVRSGVAVANPRSGVFTTLLPEQLPGTGAVKRGWTAADVTIGGQPITVFNTHLEAFGPDILRQAQAAELAAIVGAGTGRFVLVGDLNSEPGTAGHAVLTAPVGAGGAGFADAWATLHAAEPGLTCCWPGDLRLTTPPLVERIDYVLSRGALTAQEVTIVGEVEADRIASPFGALWPTDHAGLVATFDP